MSQQSIPRQDYFKYFGNGGRPKLNQSHHKRKLLPHITEEYHYRITNHLLLQKIIKPKRDKIIINSLQSLHNTSHSYKGTHSDSRSSHTSSHKRGNKTQHHSIIRTSKRYLEGKKEKSQLNQTEGWAQEDQIEENSQRRLNEGTKTTESEKRNFRIGQLHSCHHSSTILRNRVNLHGNCFTQPPNGFGKGPSILSLTNFVILSNPEIPPDCLIQLQLIEKNPSQTQPLLKKQSELVRSAPMEYFLLQREGVKFALKVSRVGDFVPVRLLRQKGVQSIELGTIDVPLHSRGEQAGVKEEHGLGGRFRKVVSGTLESTLRKGKVETGVVVRLQFRIYPKKFKEQENIQNGIQ